MKCKANKLDGTRCKANSMNGSSFCFRHNKTVKEQAFEASSNGGKANRQYHKLGNKVKLETPDDIKKLMAEAINSLWTGKMPANNPAGSLGYLAKTFLEAYDKSNLEERIEDLEKRLDSLKK